MRTLGGILAVGGIPDVTRMGWPTLRAGFPLTTFLNAMREMRATATRRSPANAMPVMAVIGAGAGTDRSIVALNIALAAARDGARVLMIDADHVNPCAFEQGERPRQDRGQPSRLAQHRQQGLARDQDRERNLDPAGDQGLRRQGRRRHPQGDRAGAFRRRLRSGDPRRTGDALERRRPQAARYRRRPRRDPAGQSRHQRRHGRHHRGARRRRAQADRCRPQRTQPRGHQPQRDKQYA